MESFPDIENMTINRFHKSYMESKGHPDFRYVNLGLWTVDIKELLKFLTAEPENKEMHRFVIRGQTHNRQRPQNSRFVVGSDGDSLTKLSITDNEVDGYTGNWLGNTWYTKHNKEKMPSLN